MEANELDREIQRLLEERPNEYKPERRRREVHKLKEDKRLVRNGLFDPYKRLAKVMVGGMYTDKEVSRIELGVEDYWVVSAFLFDREEYLGEEDQGLWFIEDNCLYHNVGVLKALIYVKDECGGDKLLKEEYLCTGDYYDFSKLSFKLGDKLSKEDINKVNNLFDQRLRHDIVTVKYTREDLMRIYKEKTYKTPAMKYYNELIYHYTHNKMFKNICLESVGRAKVKQNLKEVTKSINRGTFYEDEYIFGYLKACRKETDRYCLY